MASFLGHRTHHNRGQRGDGSAAAKTTKTIRIGQDADDDAGGGDSGGAREASVKFNLGDLLGPEVTENLEGIKREFKAGAPRKIFSWALHTVPSTSSNFEQWFRPVFLVT